MSPASSAWPSRLCCIGFCVVGGGYSGGGGGWDPFDPENWFGDGEDWGVEYAMGDTDGGIPWLSAQKGFGSGLDLRVLRREVAGHVLHRHDRVGQRHTQCGLVLHRTQLRSILRDGMGRHGRVQRRLWPYLLTRNQRAADDSRQPRYRVEGQSQRFCSRCPGSCRLLCRFPRPATCRTRSLH